MAQRGWLEGRASVTAAATDLRLEESGRLVFGGHVSDASQHYRIVLGDGGAQVFRADGSHFHDLDLSSGWAGILHRCGDDMYRGRYRALNRDAYRVAWRVTGPRKNYRMTSLYTRVVSQPP
ncbi:MAG: hypothetical protein J0H61_03265 [Alphaproteobacteria bacterium]|nr:hypothetical protein [Alphaproteobacteria bacterium]